MTKQEYEDGLMELNAKRAKMVLPFEKEMSKIILLRLEIKQQISDLRKQYDRYAADYEIFLQKKKDVNADFAKMKSQLKQRYEQNHVEEERVSPDKESLYKVRSCVLACLKKSLAGMCNTDGIQFNFYTAENGDVRFECHIPDDVCTECDVESVGEDDKEY